MLSQRSRCREAENKKGRFIEKSKDVSAFLQPHNSPTNRRQHYFAVAYSLLFARAYFLKIIYSAPKLANTKSPIIQRDFGCDW